MLDVPRRKTEIRVADIRNVINTEVDDYFNIMLRFDNGVTATVELGTYIWLIRFRINGLNVTGL